MKHHSIVMSLELSITHPL